MAFCLDANWPGGISLALLNQNSRPSPSAELSLTVLPALNAAIVGTIILWLFRASDAGFAHRVVGGE